MFPRLHCCLTSHYRIFPRSQTSAFIFSLAFWWRGTISLHNAHRSSQSRRFACGKSSPHGYEGYYRRNHSWFRHLWISTKLLREGIFGFPWKVLIFLRYTLIFDELCNVFGPGAELKQRSEGKINTNIWLLCHIISRMHDISNPGMWCIHVCLKTSACTSSSRPSSAVLSALKLVPNPVRIFCVFYMMFFESTALPELNFRLRSLPKA